VVRLLSRGIAVTRAAEGAAVARRRRILLNATVAEALTLLVTRRP
jgi:hypothetical protein